MANVCPTGLFFETQPIEEGLFKQASSLQTHKHPSVCLQRKEDPSWICMQMRSPRRSRPCPSKALVAGQPCGLCSSTCSPTQTDCASLSSCPAGPRPPLTPCLPRRLRSPLSCPPNAGPAIPPVEPRALRVKEAKLGSEQAGCSYFSSSTCGLLRRRAGDSGPHLQTPNEPSAGLHSAFSPFS